MSNRAIAARLGVSIDAIKFHIANILAKLDVRDKKALRLLVLDPPGTSDTTKAQEPHMNNTAVFGSIGQISRTVRDIDASRNWYELVLELPHLYTFGTLAFFACDGTRLMLTQAEKFNPDESILYFRVADIAATHAALLNKGVEFIAAPHRIHQHEDGTEEWMAFFKDPDDRPLALMTQIKGS
jgi:catechol 2,3-dioxygenase-like lactoylglutathione lyase family enzyme